MRSQKLVPLFTIFLHIRQAEILQYSIKQEQAAQRCMTLSVQCIFRGHIGKKVTKLLYLQQERMRSADVRMNACATYFGRQDAIYPRKNMAVFDCHA